MGFDRLYKPLYATSGVYQKVIKYEKSLYSWNAIKNAEI
jgi:hypothetical protein